MKKLLSIMALFVISLLSVAMFASAYSEESTLGSLSSVTVEEVNGEENDLLVVEEGNELKVEVRLENNGVYVLADNDNVDNDKDNIVDEPGEMKLVEEEAKNIEVEARLMGYDEEDTKDSKVVSSLKVGTAKKVTLNVEVPKDFKNGPNAVLRVWVYGGNDQVYVDYNLYVESASHDMEIVDVSFSPGKTVRAGESLLTTVLVENTGEKDEEDVKVTVEVPELGLSASEFLDEVGQDKKEDVPEMFLKFPATTAPGDYEVKVTVQYEDLKESVSRTETVTVIANDYLNSNMFPASDKLVLEVGPQTQQAAAGQTVSYGVALTNAGSASKALVLEAQTGGWATASLSEMLVVLEPGKSQVVYLDLAVAEDAAAGEHMASLTVKSGNEVLETVVLKANVAEAPAKAAESLSLRNGLEIALIVLVVLLVVMGLVIGFSRLRKDDDGEDQTYY